jgi:pimeloyl-ACP methyl ester carboxylesterase
MMKAPAVPLAIVLSLLVGCGSGDTRLRRAELGLGTQGVDDWIYHRLPEDPYGLGLHSPGYVVAFEKTDREAKLGLKPYKEDPKGWRLAGPDALNNADGNHLAGWLSDRQQAFLSHVVRYSLHSDPAKEWGAIRPELVYNAYTDIPCAAAQPCPALYSRGVDLLEGSRGLSIPGNTTLREAIEADVEKTGATHLILYSMGWNTDQQEALRNYNSLVGNLLAVAGPGFRPLVIAITWDSLAATGRTRIITYPFKAADGDEIVPIREAHQDLRLVMVGHSFGARVVTRALFSYPLLGISNDQVKPEQVDLVLSLQGAFSVNRFIDSAGVGKEEAPYRSFPRVAKKFALTWSEDDTANPVAVWFTGAKHAGGRPGFERAQRFSSAKNGQPEVFELATWSCSSPSPPCGGSWSLAPTASRDRVAMIDASSIVRFSTNQKGGTAHSDIYNPDMAALIWELIRQFAP